MPSSCQVVIAGAGPAGSAAAIWCARHGLDTILLEAEPFPRHRPGESLHPGVEPLFQQLGVSAAVEAAGFRRYPGHWVEWAAPRRFDAFGAGPAGPWLGYQAWRPELDAILLRGAVAAGARLRQPCRVSAALVEDARIAGVRCAEGDVRARFTIDATGGHWLQRRAGFSVRRVSRRLVARYGYRAGAAADIGGEPLLASGPAGWTWTALVRPDLYAWVRLDFARPGRRPPAPLDGLAPDGPERSADVTWRIVDECATEGYFAVGDAASVVDPAASHGVLKALMSGILAADLVVRATGGALSEADAAAAYRDWVRHWFERDTRRLADLYRTAGLSPARPQAAASIARTSFP